MESRLKKLQDKKNGFRNQRLPNSCSADDTKKKAVTQKQYNKLLSDANKELKKMKEDERITPMMQELYNKAGENDVSA
jgi:hypothetical protein